VKSLVDAAKKLHSACSNLKDELGPPLSFTYEPLDYAWQVHEQYLTRYGGLGAKTVLLGMNPGPWGMGQTGVPFGDVSKVIDYLRLAGDVGSPTETHPKRPVHGLDCTRGEVSGTRLWSIIEEIYGDADSAHQQLFVVNHCPLLMFDEEARNLTPDKLRGESAKRLLQVCDEHLREVVTALGAERVVGVGAYARKRAEIGLGDLADSKVTIDSIPHPSPASPLANRNGGADWRAEVRAVLH
jgi:single-strand selective monofunctional uracil DNA glycosylase